MALLVANPARILDERFHFYPPDEYSGYPIQTVKWILVFERTNLTYWAIFNVSVKHLKNVEQ
jgi:hypothetical protein